MKNRMRLCGKLGLLLVISGIFSLFGCNREKIDSLETSLAFLENENASLKNENISLKNEIAKLQETDQFYYQTGADAFTAGNYETTIEWMDKLKVKFPQSSLHDSANKLIADSNVAIKAAYEKEKGKLNNLLAASKKADLAEAITMLSGYVSETHPVDLLQSAQDTLASYQKKWEDEASIRQVEQTLGISLLDYKTGWRVNGSFGQQLYQPEIQLKFKNIKTDPISGPIEIIINFIEDAKGEVFGDGSTYLLGYSDTPLQPGIAKTAFVNSSVGYTRYSYNPPAITAEIYLEKDRDRIFYRKIPIKRGDM